MRFHLIPAALIFTAPALAAFAQEPPPQHQIVCSSTAGDVLKDDAARVVPISAQEAAKITPGVKALPYEGFDAARFAVSDVTFYLKRTVNRVSLWPNDNAQLRIVFSAKSQSRLTWYEVRATEKADPELLLIERTPSNASQRESGIGRVTILRATPDPTIPLFTISFHTNNDGVNTQADSQTMFLLDARQLPPKLLATLDCTQLQGGGACTAIDNTMGGSTDLACDWEPKTQNYSCEKAFDEDYDRRIHQRFALPGKTPLPLSTIEGEPKTLIEFAERINSDERWANLKPSIPGFGETTLLFRNSAKKLTAYVFGARGRGQDFNARFFAVVLGGEAPNLIEISPQPMVNWPAPQNGEQDGEPAAAPSSTREVSPSEFASGQPVKFVTKKLDAPTPAGVWQVTVTEGDHHAVNWLAAFPAASHFVFDSLKIASDGVAYSGCGRWKHEQTAIAFRPKDNKAEAEAEIQPPFEDPLSVDQENAADADQPCPMLIQVGFNLKDGFQLGKGKSLACGKSHKLAKISEDGAISPVPYVNPADQ